MFYPQMVSHMLPAMIIKRFVLGGSINDIYLISCDYLECGTRGTVPLGNL